MSVARTPLPDAKQEAPDPLPDSAALRRLSDNVRLHTLLQLDGYLESLTEAATALGTRVHFAADAPAAREVVAAVLREGAIGAIEDEQAAVCREVGLERSLRQLRFRRVDKLDRVDATILSPSFGIVETGQVCVLSEGLKGLRDGGRSIAVMGIDQWVPRLADAGVVLKLLSRDFAQRPMVKRVRLLTASDLVLVDHGRSDVLAGPRQLWCERLARRRTVRRGWVSRLARRLTGRRVDVEPPTPLDWLTPLARDLAEKPAVVCWKARA